MLDFSSKSIFNNDFVSFPCDPKFFSRCLLLLGKPLNQLRSKKNLHILLLLFHQVFTLKRDTDSTPNSKGKGFSFFGDLFSFLGLLAIHRGGLYLMFTHPFLSLSLPYPPFLPFHRKDRQSDYPSYRFVYFFPFAAFFWSFWPLQLELRPAKEIRFFRIDLPMIQSEFG